MKTSVFRIEVYHVCHCGNYGYGFSRSDSWYREEINGARGWIEIGGFSMQPAEYLKIMVVWYLSYILARRQRQLMGMDQFKQAAGRPLMLVLY